METLIGIGLQPAIIGGLIGSILTIALTKILEMIQKSKEHRYSLQKEYFTKKLSAAEEAIAAWYRAANSIGAMAKLYTQFPYLKEGMNVSMFKILHSRLEDHLNKVYEASSQVRYSVFLYFDFDDEKYWDNDSLKLFYSYLSSIANNVMIVDYGLDLLQLYKEDKNINLEDEQIKKEIEIIENAIRDQREKLGITMNQLTEVLDKSREDMIDVIKELRNQVKQMKFSKNL